MDGQFDQTSTLLFIGVGVVLLCFLGIALFVAFQFFGNILGTFVNFFGLFFDVIQGGPLAWCGCLLLVGACAICAGIAYLWTTCGTENAMNFCLLFGG
jgi:uncharacterized membrane protein